MKFYNNNEEKNFIDKEGNISLKGHLKFNSFIQPNEIVFMCGKNKVLILEPNGDIYVKGKLVENDKEVVEGLREFLKFHNEVRNETKTNE
jgi:hypothetical protein